MNTELIVAVIVVASVVPCAAIGIGMWIAVARGVRADQQLEDLRSLDRAQEGTPGRVGERTRPASRSNPQTPRRPAHRRAPGPGGLR